MNNLINFGSRLNASFLPEEVTVGKAFGVGRGVKLDVKAATAAGVVM